MFEVTFRIDDPDLTAEEIESALKDALPMWEALPTRLWVGRNIGAAAVFQVDPNYTVREVQ